jgi:hypothetical protein
MKERNRINGECVILINEMADESWLKATYGERKLAQ